MPKPPTVRPPRNPHDAFFKWLLGRSRNADRFIRERLPADVAAELGPATPVPRRGSFVDADLKEHLSDLLFEVRLIGGMELFVYVLVEHKSRPDRLTPL